LARDSGPLARLRIATEADRGYKHILGRIAEVVERLESETGMPRPTTIGIGTPGTLDPATGRMKNCNTQCLNGSHLHADLEHTLRTHVRIANDANCLALAEARLGAARGASTVFGVILGTGVGGGLVVNGEVIRGLHGIAGEWGHMTLDPAGIPCYCGRRGCVETLISGPVVEAAHRRCSGQQLRVTEIAALADSDPRCAETIGELCTNFGRALAQVINLLDPDIVVLGGGLSRVPPLYSLGRRAILPHLFNPSLHTPIVAAQLGDSAGVFGAAMLAASADRQARPQSTPPR
jgi:predicted NBD/HSP70 family sugar kinase